LITIEHIYPKAFYLAMIKKSTRYLTLLVLFISLCFCADAGYLKPGNNNRSGKKTPAIKPAPGQITAFKIPQQIGPESIVNNPAGNYIGIPVHAGTNVTALIPTITVTPGSTVTPTSGAPQNFTNAVGYTVDGVNFYSVNVLQARTAVTCDGIPTTITGDPPPAIPGTYVWEILNPATSTWSPAAGTNINPDYTTATLSSNPNAPKLYTFRRSITTAFGIAYDSYTDLTVLPPLSNNMLTAPAITSFCASGNPATIIGTLPTGGDNVNYTYVWQNSTDGGNTFNDIPGTNVKDYTPPAITLTTSYRRTVTSGACNVPSISLPVTITIQNALANNTLTAPAITSFCASGNPATIVGTLPTGGDNVNYTYVWQSSTDGGNTFNDISGTDVKDYIPPAITVTTSYRRTVTSGACTTPSISLPIKITITPAITSNVINQPPNAVYCETSSPVTITVQPPSGGDGTYTYQWTSSTDNITYNPINSATAPDYAVPALTTTTWFKRVVSSGACIGTSTSSPVVITVYQQLANNILTPPPVSSFCQSGDADPIIGSTPTGGDSNYTYQWQQSSTNTAASFTDINGQTGASFDPPNLTSTMFYRRVVMNGICTTPLISNIIEIHITPPLTGNGITPPLTTTFCTSVDPAIIPGGFPSGGDGPGTYIYQWQSMVEGGNWVDIPGANAIDYDSPPVMVTTSLRRNVTSGACQIQFPSNVIKFTIINSPPNISANPVAPICSGSKATISVASPDPALTYFWYTTPAKDFILFTGPVYITDPLTANQTFYLEASNGTCSSPVLASATVTVNPLPAAPTLATNPVSTCQGSTAVLAISNPQPGYTYNWYTTATAGTPVATNTNFTTPPITNNITYYAEAVNSTGCVSATRTPVNVSPIPLAQVKLTGSSVCPGEPGTLTSDNIDPTIDINWFATPTSTDILYTGNSFIAPPVTANTTYYAEVANSCVPAVRASAQVQVIQQLPTPVISVESAVAPSITFWWISVQGATGYEVSTDNGQTFTAPSSGSNGTTHTVAGLQIGQSVTIIVRATGGFSCQLSNNSTPVTGTATNPLVDQIFVANAFTPNGDGKNDIVYDQWGELLYVSQSQQNGWDGSFKGKTEPAGVYVYYLEAVMNDGQQVKKKGTITLLR
jgi:hypothetical protein